MRWSAFLLLVMGQCSVLTCHLYEYHFISDRKTWFEAQNYCRRYHTDLATVRNATDMGRLSELSGEEGWIGLYAERNTKGTWYWSLELSDCEVTWGDLFSGELPCNEEHPISCKECSKFILVTDAASWLEAQSYCCRDPDPAEDLNLSCESCESRSAPWLLGLFRDTWRWSDGNDSCGNRSGGFQGANETQCVAMGENRRWKSDGCARQKPFFCYNDKVILVKEKKTWDEALKYCREHHHDLASVTSSTQQRRAEETAKTEDDLVWLGLRYTCTLDLWFWVSSKLVCYENWASGEPGGACDMAGAMNDDGKWVSKDKSEKFHFICSLKSG